MEDTRYCPNCCIDRKHILCEENENSNEGFKEWICLTCNTPSEYRKGE